jgi:hypothetical protein
VEKKKKLKEEKRSGKFWYAPPSPHKHCEQSLEMEFSDIGLEGNIKVKKSNIEEEKYSRHSRNSCRSSFRGGSLQGRSSSIMNIVSKIENENEEFSYSFAHKI